MVIHHPRQVSSLQRGPHGPDRDLLEVKAVGHAGLQGLKAAHLDGNALDRYLKQAWRACSLGQRPVVDDDPLESADLVGVLFSCCREVSRLSVSSVV